MKALSLAESQGHFPKPCTKLQYILIKSRAPLNDPTIARFDFYPSNPPRVEVKEEYLVYDLVSMIGSIGGTMGVCIGLTYNVLLRIGEGLSKIKVLFSKIYNRKRCKTEPVMVMEQEPRRLDTNKLIDALDKRVLRIEKRTQEGFDNILSRLKEMETKTNKHQCQSNHH